jgi:phosphate transport system substrate-binding protein
MKKLSLFLTLAVAGAALAQGGLLINGAGATFPFPLYSKWFSEYNKLFPALKFNYQSIGSGGGIKQITEKTVDFGASDAPLSDEELAKAPGLLNLPTVLGSVVVAYNLPGVTLNLSGATVAGIFLGTIAKWNDAAISKDNPGVKLPDTAIAVATRSDASGTNYVFTDYLAKVSPAFKAKVGVGKSVKWPTGLGGKGNEGVTGLLKATPGAVGYLELAYVMQNPTLSIAAIQNADGAFVKPSIEATSAAAAGVAMPDDFRVSITNAPGKDAYPISSFTYLLVYKDQPNKEKGPPVINFLRWAVTDGEKYAPALYYAPLPPAVQTKVLAKIATLTVQGAQLSAGK